MKHKKTNWEDMKLPQPNRPLTIEIKAANKVLVFEMPAGEFMQAMKRWTEKYPYQYFENRETSKNGIIIRPPWEKTEIPIKINERIKHFRKKLKLTQVELAERSGISQGNIASIETGNRLIGKEVAEKLGKALEVDYRMFL